MPPAVAAKKSKSAPTKPDVPASKPKESNRDFIEQIVVAFILAFVVRGFEAEAFVIPTGSMAPTLMGRHKEVACRQCGHVYQVNASEDAEMAALARGNGRLIEVGVCGNCRFRDENLAESPSFKGDRILVMKFLYDLPFLPGANRPKRWDVVVFHYPEEPETNYIKRCIGLPNEELRVYFGDILTRPRGSDGPFRLERKPPEHQQAMQMLVYNDAHRPAAFRDLPEWRRWTSSDWKEVEPGTFETTGASGQRRELRYRHLVPDPKQWEDVLRDGSPSAPRSTLVTDYYAYNSGEHGGLWYQPHWVGDLTLSCRLEVLGNSGVVRLELIEGGIPHRGEIDLATGMATLFRGDQALGPPVATTVKGPGAYNLTLANVDDRLTLWVDGRTPFGDGLEYDGGPSHVVPTAADLSPAAVSAHGASVRVSGLVLKRDIYYTQVPGQSDYSGLSWDGAAYDYNQRVVDLFDRLSDPRQFASLGDLKPKDYVIRPGHYMMMGDNSPRSKDGRGWESRDQLNPDFPEKGWDPNPRQYWEVPEALLIGKAFYVYWPHGKPTGPDIRVTRDFRLPFRPYFERMKWIR